MQPNTPLTKMYAGSDLMLNGGAKGIRTPGLYNANVARYQLCYSPIFIFPPNQRLARALSWRPGLEPANDIIANRPSECNTPPQIFFGVHVELQYILDSREKKDET